MHAGHSAIQICTDDYVVQESFLDDKLQLFQKQGENYLRVCGTSIVALWGTLHRPGISGVPRQLIPIVRKAWTSADWAGVSATGASLMRAACRRLRGHQRGVP
jgi:hypothetical protein